MFNIDAMRKHPDFQRVVDTLAATAMRTDGPGRAVASAHNAACHFALTGKELAYSRPVLQHVRMNVVTALQFENASHEITLNHLPMLATASVLWPLAKEKLNPLIGTLFGDLMTGRVMATNLFTGLRAAAMAAWALWGKAAAAGIVKEGFGTSHYQYGLPYLLSNAFYPDGYPRSDRERLGHLANIVRPACVWLCKHFDGVCPRAFYSLPVRCLLKGDSGYVTPSSIVGHPFATGPANDEYETSPVLGPIWSWPKSDDPSHWAVEQIRKTAVPDIHWLTAENLTTSWTPPTTTRTIGPWRFESERKVTFTPYPEPEFTNKASRVKAVTVIEV